MSNLLKDVFPNIFIQLDKEKNVGINLNKLTYGSSRKVWWICEKGHSYCSLIKDRSHGHGCNICSGRFPSQDRLARIVIPEIMMEFDRENNDLDINSLSYGSSKKVWWVCKEGHKYSMSVYDRYRGRGCPKCSGNEVSDKNRLKILFPEIYSELHPDKNSNINTEDISFSSNKKVWWICKNGHSYFSSPNSRMAGHGCKFCASQAVCEDNCLATKKPELVKEWSYKNKIKPNEVLPFSMKKVWWICENNHEWKTTIADRSSGSGCSKCSKRVSKPSQEWLDSLGVPEECREITITIKEIKFFVDAFVPETNTIYEFNGDYWHGNPKIYSYSDVNSHNKKTFGELYKQTTSKRDMLVSGGFEVISIWESEWKRKI